MLFASRISEWTVKIRPSMHNSRSGRYLETGWQTGRKKHNYRGLISQLMSPDGSESETSRVFATPSVERVRASVLANVPRNSAGV